MPLQLKASGMVNGGRLGLALLLCSVTLALTSVVGQSRPPAESIQNEVVQRFRTGQAAMQEGRWNDAVEEFRKVLQLEPDLVEARVNLGLAYHALGEYQLAVSELSQTAKRQPDLLPANLFLGISYLKLGSPDKAIAPLNRVLQIDPSNREGRRALAAAELSEGRYGEAARQFRRLASTDPDKADEWFALGQDYLRMSKLLTADLSSQFARTVWSFRLAGDILGERRLWNDAASAYRRALEAGTAPAGLHSALGTALLYAGKTAEAESEFEAELARDSFDPSALLGMAQAELLKGTAPAALEPLRKIWKSAPEVLVQATDFPLVDLPHGAARQMIAELNSVPTEPPREFLLSALFRILGDAERARQELESLESSRKVMIASLRKRGAPSRLDCDQDQVHLAVSAAGRRRYSEGLCAEFLASEKRPQFNDLVQLGRTLLILGQPEGASDAFAAALEQNRKSPEAIYWLNRSYLRLSVDCFNRLMVSYPDSWRTHELKAEALHLRQADQEAMEEYRAAERMNPADPRIHESLGEILLDQKKLEEANSELETALDLDPTAARSLHLMGRLYVDQHEPAEAIPYLESALRHDPNLLEARWVLGKAYLKIGRPDLAVPQLERSTQLDRYGDLHYQLYEAYRQEGKAGLAAQALARSQELRRKSAADDQAKIKSATGSEP